jgi:hypothetical protein
LRRHVLSCAGDASVLLLGVSIFALRTVPGGALLRAQQQQGHARQARPHMQQVMRLSADDNVMSVMWLLLRVETTKTLRGTLAFGYAAQSQLANHRGSCGMAGA